jgi:selenocysteine lyase/cysteine desulfurase
MKLLVAICFVLFWMSSPIHSFGHALLPLFSLNPSYTNINHGSYGSAPKYVHEKLREYQIRAEHNPDRWFRIEIQIEMEKLRKKLSKYVNCDADDLVILDNASAGINSILRSLKFQSNETILYYNIAYGMVKLTLQYISTEIFTQEQIIEIDLDHQTIQNTDLLLRKTQDTLNKIKNVKLVVFDHISSVPAVLFDAEKMIRFFRQKNILTLVDGAHVVGGIELDLKQLNPDFYVSNTHKWLYNHRSACLLYVKKDLQKLIHPMITSFGYLQSFQDEFFWLGTKDYSPYLTISDALDFRKTIADEKAIFSYNHQLAIQAGNLLAKLWDSSTLTTDQKYISTMNNVELPLTIDTSDKMTALYQKLINEHDIFLPMFPFDNKFYCRISAQIYMELKDYETVGHIVLNAISNMKFELKLNPVKDNPCFDY